MKRDDYDVFEHVSKLLVLTVIVQINSDESLCVFVYSLPMTFRLLANISLCNQ